MTEAPSTVDPRQLARARASRLAPTTRQEPSADDAEPTRGASLALRHPPAAHAILVGDGALAARGGERARAGSPAAPSSSSPRRGAARSTARRSTPLAARGGGVARCSRSRTARRRRPSPRPSGSGSDARGRRQARQPAARLRRRQRRRPRRLRRRLLPARHRVRPGPDHPARPGGRRDRRQDRRSTSPAARTRVGALPPPRAGGRRHRAARHAAAGGAALRPGRGDQDGGAARPRAPRRGSSATSTGLLAGDPAALGAGGGRRGGGEDRGRRARSRRAGRARGCSTSATPSGTRSRRPAATPACATARRWPTACCFALRLAAPPRPADGARRPPATRCSAASSCRRCRALDGRRCSRRRWRATRRRARAGSPGSCRAGPGAGRPRPRTSSGRARCAAELGGFLARASAAGRRDSYNRMHAVDPAGSGSPSAAAPRACA